MAEGNGAPKGADVLKQLGVSDANIARAEAVPAKPGRIDRVMNSLRGNMRAAGFAALMAASSACGNVGAGCGVLAGEDGVGAGIGVVHEHDGRVRGVGVGAGSVAFDLNVNQAPAGETIELSVDGNGRMVQTGGPRQANIPQAREQAEERREAPRVVETPGNRSPSRNVNADGERDLGAIFR